MNLVTINGSEAVTTTLTIAQGTENEHKAVIQLVRQYQGDLEEFGRVTFEMAPFETAGGVQSREIATLNEQQSTLLLTYMRNSGIVRAFKKALVRAFFEMRNPTPPQQAARQRAVKPGNSDTVRALLLVSRSMAKIEGVTQVRLASVTNDAIEEATGLPTRLLNKALPTVAPKDVPDLNATQVGEPLGIKPVTVNKLLETLGLQFKDTTGRDGKTPNWAWRLTEAGSAFGELRPYDRNGHSDWQIGWKPSVREVITNHNANNKEAA